MALQCGAQRGMVQLCEANSLEIDVHEILIYHLA